MGKVTAVVSTLWVAGLGVLAIYTGDATALIVSGVVTPLANALANALPDGTFFDAFAKGLTFGWNSGKSMGPVAAK